MNIQKIKTTNPRVFVDGPNVWGLLLPQTTEDGMSLVCTGGGTIEAHPSNIHSEAPLRVVWRNPDIKELPHAY